MKKEAVIQVKRSDLERIKEEATTEAADQAMFLMLSIPLMCLRDKHGFETAECEQLINEMLDLYDSFEKGYVSFEDLEKCLWEEGSVKVERKGNKQ